jgi:hypothetical protein
LGYPRSLVIEATLRPNWRHQDFWRNVLSSGIALCRGAEPANDQRVVRRCCNLSLRNSNVPGYPYDMNELADGSECRGADKRYTADRVR